jgi:methanogen extracellular protein (TIGR04279 family)
MLMLLLAFTSTAVGSPTGDEYFVNIAIDGNENVTFADHTSSPTDGNWIALKGGTSVKLPSPLTFGYHGINSTSYVSNGKAISITANVENNTDHIIEYPYGKHPMLTNVSGKNDLDIEFYGSQDFAGKAVDVYLIRTSPSSLKNAFDAAAKGDTSSFRNLLSSSYEISLNKSLNNSGDMSMSFGGVDAGDYVMFVLLNTSYLTGANDLSILSATTFQVLEYDSIMSAPAMAAPNSTVLVSMSLMNASNASYTYGALLVHKNAYRAAVRLEFNGTKAGTNLMINDADLIKGYKIADVGLSNVNKTIATDLINDIIGANNGTVTVKTTDKNSTSILLDTEELNNGNYVLIVGVYKSGENLVAFGQSDVTISSGTSSQTSSSGGGGHYQPTVVQNESIEEDVGEVEEDVPKNKGFMSVANRPTGDAEPDVIPTTEFKTTEPGYKRLLQLFIEFVSYLWDIIINLVW